MPSGAEVLLQPIVRARQVSNAIAGEQTWPVARRHLQEVGVGGAQTGRQGLALGVRERTHKDGRSHVQQHTTFSTTFSEPALAKNERRRNLPAPLYDR